MGGCSTVLDSEVWGSMIDCEGGRVRAGRSTNSKQHIVYICKSFVFSYEYM